jgi:glycosidase
VPIDASVVPFDVGIDAALTTEDAAIDSDSGDELDGGEGGMPSEVQWRRRPCSVSVRFTPGPGASVVQLAGDFTGWGDAPLPMSDLDGDGVFELRLGPETGLEPGTLHAYRIIVDGQYLLDPAAPYRKYDGDCVNSGLLAPACTSGPEIAPGRLMTSYDAVTGTGRASVQIAILAAIDDVSPERVDFNLDGAAIDGSSLTLDETTGTFAVELEGLESGRHVLSVRARDALSREADPIDLPFWIEEKPFDWRDATMYMVMVDRFANGDRSIDMPVGAPVEYPADFHGGDLVGVTEAIRSGYFDTLGINALWLSPISIQASGHFQGRDDARRYAGYHGYWPARGRGVEPRFGGDAALHALVEEAHRHGIRVLLDLINNQVHEQHEYFTAHPDWFRTGCVCGIDIGCGWSERPLDCLFAPYLPDINWRNVDAEAQFTSDAVYWIENFGIDGFRIDAVKHVETNSVVNLRAAVARRFEQAGYRHYFVGETAVTEGDSVDYGCGERFANGYEWLDGYTGRAALDGQFDFPSHHRLGGLIDGSMGFDAVEQVVEDMRNRLRPEGLHVRFLGTHDSARIASRAAMDGRAGCHWLGGGCGSLPSVSSDPLVYARLRRAMAVLYTMPGIPFLYYGDEIGMPGGGDPDSRRDMLFEGPLSSVAMSREALTSEQRSLHDFMGALGRARRESEALRRGRRITLVAESDLYVIAFADEATGEFALTVANRGGELRGRAIDGLSAGQLEDVTSFERAVGSSGAVRRGSGNRIFLDLNAGEAAVFVAR